MDNNEISGIFDSALADPDILSARLNVLDTGAKILGELGSHAFVHGLLVGDKETSAFSILSRLAADITVGFATLMRSGNEYSAAALLRQLVEFEYLFFVAYQDKSELGKWLGADADTLRKQFTTQKSATEIQRNLQGSRVLDALRFGRAPKSESTSLSSGRKQQHDDGRFSSPGWCTSLPKIVDVSQIALPCLA